MERLADIVDVYCSFPAQQIITVNEHVLRFRVIEALGKIFDQYSRLELGLLVFTDPDEFEALGFGNIRSCL